MNEKNMFCKADIRYKKATKIWIIWYVLFAVLNFVSIFAGIFEALDDEDYFSGWGNFNFDINLMFFPFLEIDSDRGQLLIGFPSWAEWYLIFGGIFLFLFGLFVPLIISSVSKSIANGCSLSLTKDGIQGVRKTLFSTKNLQLPIEKVDSVMVSHNFFNLIGGGKTVSVRSNSGLVKFPWVHNADEFVAATLQQIETFKKNAAAAPAPTADASLSDKLKELQSLKDQGILTEEQFEAKKQELIARF